MKKIGILGGTFNPIHHGHLILGQAAKEEFGLDEILVMPTKNPAYKTISGPQYRGYHQALRPFLP